jgi:hypothetical protein
MDRISALRNVEEAIREFERGEADLAATERRVATVLRTYATEFDEEREELAAFRARGDDPADGVVVVAASPPDARERVCDLLGVDPGGDAPAFDVERL